MKFPSNNFDGLRLTGALLVLVSHQFALAGRDEPPLGGMGLAIFFSVSGYLVTMSWFNDPHVPRFAARRLLRIWPGMAWVVTLTALAASFVPGKAPAALHFLQNLGFRFWDGEFFPTERYRQLDGPLYTIPYEMLCYVGVCVSGVLFGRRIKWVLLLGVPVAVVVGVLLTGSGAIKDFLGAYRSFVGLAAYFVAGAAVFHLPVLQRGRSVIVALGVGAVCLAIGKAPAAMLLAMPITVIYIGRRSWPGLRSAGRHGDLSYGIYLWAWPVTQLGVVLLHPETPLPILLGVTLLGTFPLAWVSWHLVEKRALRLKPSARDRVASARPAPAGSATS